MSDAASDKFIFGKGFDHDTIADHKLDMTEIAHTVPGAIQHLLHTARDTNAVSALDPEPRDRTTRYDQGPVTAPPRRFSFCLRAIPMGSVHQLSINRLPQPFVQESLR
jgi:hypothetical protein